MSLGEYIKTPNTVGLWHLNGNSTDDSGNGNNGTDTDITYSKSNGKFNDGASFNGSSSKIVTGNCNYGTYFTVSIWVRPNNVVQKDFARLIESNYTTGFSLNYYNSSGVDTIYATVKGVGVWVTGSATVVRNVWQNVILTYNGAKISVYVNGKLSYFQNSSTNPTLTNAPIYIGEYVGGGDYYFNGSIDEVVLENRAWTQQEIQKYYTNALGRFATL